jgi:purine-binding chemotaxis protein CheW
VPGAPESIKGILNLRGQLIVAFDMATTLGIDAELNTLNPVSIIVDVDSSRISLLVDRVGDILPLNESTFESPPSNFPTHIRQAVLGAHKLHTELLIVLDPYLFIKDLISNSNPVNTSVSDLLTLSQ